MASSRYIEDKEIRAMRVRTWVEAVMYASGITLVELEQKFSENRLSDPVARSCIWDKYRNGYVVPRIGKRPNGDYHLANRVEACYPGTMLWLTSPIWRLADKAPMEMTEIRKIYEGMPYLFRSMFVEVEHKVKGVFWRRYVEIDKCCETLRNLETLPAFISLLTIIKEAEIIQDQDVHDYVFDVVIEYKDKLIEHPILNFVTEWMFEYLSDRWKNAGYFD